jgi:hypothetical protein
VRSRAARFRSDRDRERSWWGVVDASGRSPWGYALSFGIVPENGSRVARGFSEDLEAVAISAQAPSQLTARASGVRVSIGTLAVTFVMKSAVSTPCTPQDGAINGFFASPHPLYRDVKGA